jgi:transcriptional regulator with XRE-family HTH domain
MRDMTPETPIRRCRKRSGETVREVAAALHVTERTYIRWEQGDATPDGENLVALADHFGVHPRTLLHEQQATSGKAR